MASIAWIMLYQKSKKVLSAFGIGDEDIKSLALQISNMLENSQSLLQASDEMEELEARPLDLQNAKQEIETKQVMDAFKKSGNHAIRIDNL